jgi:DNA helicase IV
VSSQELRKELDLEQRYVSGLYVLLDQTRDEADAALDGARRTPAFGTPAARSERDAYVALHSARVAQLRGVEDRLCFGRLDVVPADAFSLGEARAGTGGGDGPERRYIGRIGLTDDDSATREQRLIDWRAPAAQAFYQATAASPAGVLRRRHIATEGRKVTGIEDEILDLNAFASAGDGAVAGEGALFVALNAARTGRMRDIVSTIQSEQDRVIRAPLEGVLVIQGGPGTGKTAVALHRTAFLLYTHRERIARSGVLVVGPNAVFLRYIEQVLPALGEAGAVVMSTPGRLFPGVDATTWDSDDTSRVKGDLRMAEVLARAIANRQRIPARAMPMDVEGSQLLLRPRDVAQAREHARRSAKPHNEARVTFVKDILGRLARQLGDATRTELTPDNRAELIAALRESKDVRREVNWCWGPITPQRLVRNLFADPVELSAAAEGILSLREQSLLRRPRAEPWSHEDVGLLDEAAELLGDPESGVGDDTDRAKADRKMEIEHAERVLETSGTGGMLNAQTLADRYAGFDELSTLAERASDDRRWAFGHIVIDEAQELSAMMWRLLLRRCPTRSMTIVGDVAQTGAAAGVTSWSDALRPYVANRWRLERLEINYRTPSEIMAIAADVLATAETDEKPPRSARDGRWLPTAQRVDSSQAMQDAILDAVRADLLAVDGGRVAVICPAAIQQGIAVALSAALPTGQVVSGTHLLDAPVSVLSVAEVKGLEFDSVVLVEPADILAESARGANDLYVALTRSTQRLHVVHRADLPDSLSRLRDSEPATGDQIG